MTIPEYWKKNDDTLELSLQCKGFNEAANLILSIASIAEDHNHHPDVSIKGYNNVKITTTTHDFGGLTEKDYKLAKDISKIVPKFTK